jgi:ABC-2 type transport system ATP-binding protein
MNMRSVENLAKTYPGTRKSPPVEAVRGISFEVAAGEFFGLLGLNGAGNQGAGRLRHLERGQDSVSEDVDERTWDERCGRGIGWRRIHAARRHPQATPCDDQ